MSIPERTSDFSFDMSSQLFSRTLGSDWDKCMEVKGNNTDNKTRLKLMFLDLWGGTGCPKTILRTCNNDDRTKPESEETICTVV